MRLHLKSLRLYRFPRAPRGLGSAGFNRPWLHLLKDLVTSPPFPIPPEPLACEPDSFCRQPRPWRTGFPHRASLCRFRHSLFLCRHVMMLPPHPVDISGSARVPGTQALPFGTPLAVCALHFTALLLKPDASTLFVARRCLFTA